MVRDKAHFFGSLERVTIDSGITINMPARPDFNTTTVTETRVWNTIARFDHQVNSNHTWGVRWLREDSPQYNQIINPAATNAATLAAAREENDVDQTVVTSLNSVLGNTRVNTLRVGWTQEDVSFGNPCFNGNGRNQAACAPTLSFPTFTDQQNATRPGARQRRHPDRRHAVVVPARQEGRPRRQAGRAVAVLAVAERYAGQPERHVHASA